MVLESIKLGQIPWRTGRARQVKGAPQRAGTRRRFGALVKAWSAQKNA